jgi:hypothetical protein
MNFLLSVSSFIHAWNSKISIEFLPLKISVIFFTIDHQASSSCLGSL